MPPGNFNSASRCRENSSRFLKALGHKFPSKNCAVHSWRMPLCKRNELNRHRHTKTEKEGDRGSGVRCVVVETGRKLYHPRSAPACVQHRRSHLS